MDANNYVAPDGNGGFVVVVNGEGPFTFIDQQAAEIYYNERQTDWGAGNPTSPLVIVGGNYTGTVTYGSYTGGDSGFGLSGGGSVSNGDPGVAIHSSGAINQPANATTPAATSGYLDKAVGFIKANPIPALVLGFAIIELLNNK